MIGELVQKIIVARNTYEFSFSTREDFHFSPGQYVNIKIINPRYKDYQMNERLFSLVNSPAQKRIIKIVFRYRESGFKKNLLAMSVGEQIEAGQALGLFSVKANDKTPLVFLAGGVGIAPFISILEHLSEKKDTKRRIFLFFSNTSRADAPYFDRIDNFARKFLNLEVVNTFTKEGQKRLTFKKIREGTPDFAQASFYICGKPEFVEDLCDQMINDGISKDRIFREGFDGY